MAKPTRAKILKRIEEKREKDTHKKKYSLVDVQRAINLGIVMRKHTKGHLFTKNLKDHCTFCGATQKTKEECPYHFLTFLDRMQTALINPSFFDGKDIQALYLQHGEEYQDIKLPLINYEKN